MSILRTTTPTNSSPNAFSRPPLRVFASGTLFLTHKLLVPSYPEAGGVARAQSVQSNRGGHGANVLAVLAQFRPSRPHILPNAVPVPIVGPISGGGPSARSVGDVQFCGPLGGSEEGGLVVKELEEQGVATAFSVTREGKAVPAAWVIESGDGTKTIINHNPLPDMTHDEFVSRLGPILAPENYDIPSSPPLPPSASASTPHSHARKHSGSGHQLHGSPANGHVQPPYAQFVNSGTPPFDWMHFEGRAAQTTLANITGLNGLARERGWRSRSVFSLQISRAGVEVLIQHVDVVFFSKAYAQTVTPSTSPRSFLISMSAHAAPHALLVVDWGMQGAALLSVPTREYLQSSGWVETVNDVKPSWDNNEAVEGEGFTSVRTGSGFWADGRPQSGVTVTGSEGSRWTESAVLPTSVEEHVQTHSDGDTDSQRTSLETERGTETQVVDPVGAHEAFVAGMIFALSQRILPGRPYTREDATKTHNTQALIPSGSVGADVLPGGSGGGSGRWRLEECLRFATELSGRKGRRMGFHNLRLEMEKGGWVVE